MSWGEKKVSIEQRGDGFVSMSTHLREELSETEKLAFDALEDGLVMLVTIDYLNGLTRKISRS